MDLPLRYKREFIYQPERLGYRVGYRQEERWICRHCGQAIRPNTAGAQSHIAKHVRAAAVPQADTKE